MQRSFSKKISALLSACLLLAAGTSHAASTTGVVNVSGYLASAAPPPACYIKNTPTLTFSGTPTADRMWSTAGALLYIQCPSGVPYTVAATTAWAPITIGGQPAGAELTRNDENNLYTTPWGSTGTGSDQGFTVWARIGGVTPNSNLNPAVHIGAVSGSIGVTLSW